MASQIPGFENDIFISYRQNDNKAAAGGGSAEGWVTEFVTNLSQELESTVKGKVNIYFDLNPHDGLLETHNVDESLGLKLRTLIFMPIVSQTYCDSASFAWRNEFLAFLRTAAGDRLGLSVKLPNGNVTGRVLPIRIHELESSDVQMLEKELGTKLRPVDFVFKAPGVNRPLRAKEEDPLKNANRILYRDQVNKAANAIKEILSGLGQLHAPEVREDREKTKAKTQLLPDLGKSASSSRSIVVLPFQTNPTDKDTEFLGEELAEDLSSALKHIRALRSLNLASRLTTGSDQKTIRAAAEKSGATSFLEGSVTLTGNKAQVTANLIESRNGSPVWQGQYECARQDLAQLKEKILVAVCEKLAIPLKESERKIIQRHISSNGAAAELSWRGRYHWRRRGNELIRSLDYFQQAVEADPACATAHAGMATACILLGYYDLVPFQEAMSKSKAAAMKALDIDPSVTEAYLALAYVSLCYEWNWPEAEHNFIKVFAINPQNPTALKKYQLCLTQIKCCFEEAEDEPIGGIPHFLHAFALLHKGKFDEGLKASLKAMELDPNSFMAHRAAGLCFLGLGYEKEALEALTAAAKLSNRHPWVLFDLIGAYATMAHNEGAQDIMEEAMARANALPARINDFFFQPT